MEIHAIGIDLGKTLFHPVAVDAKGNVVVRKRCSRTQLLTDMWAYRPSNCFQEICHTAINASGQNA